jgi:hypothetical protein
MVELVVNGIARVWKAALALMGAAALGAALTAVVSAPGDVRALQKENLPERVRSLEHWRETTNHALAVERARSDFTVCRAAQQDRGKDPAACRTYLPEADQARFYR